jgi:hypothetical protein
MIPPGALFMHGAVAVGKARRFCGDSNYLSVVYCSTERELSRKEVLLQPAAIGCTQKLVLPGYRKEVFTTKSFMCLRTLTVNQNAESRRMW